MLVLLCCMDNKKKMLPILIKKKKKIVYAYIMRNSFYKDVKRFSRKSWCVDLKILLNSIVQGCHKRDKRTKDLR